MLDNREWAALIWLAIAFFLALLVKGCRSGLWKALLIFRRPVILIPFGVFTAYVGLELFLGHRVGLWRPSLIKGTIFWFLISGFSLFFNFVDASRKPGFFKRKVRATIGGSLLLEFLVNLSPMSLAAELILQPIAAIIASTALVANRDKRHNRAKPLLEYSLALIGLWMFGFSIWTIYHGWSEIDKASLLLQFLLPVWLTIGVLPFIYMLGLYLTYESIFNAIESHRSDWKACWRARFAVLSKFGFKMQDAQAFVGHWPCEVVSASDFRSARAVMTEFLERRREKKRAAIKEKERLERYAGSEGTDVDGRCLDRREFKETTKSLRWLATCQSGWYHKEKRYRHELLDLVKTGFPSYGLPAEAGITMKVARDGQSWYAWRRTITGWCFAIGAAGPPDQDWEYDGPEPPDGFPAQDDSWGNGPFSYRRHKNWNS